MHELAEFSPHHVFEIGCQLRGEDLEELFAHGFSNPFDGLYWSVNDSDDVQTIYLDGVPVGLFGYQEDGEGGCQVWAMGSDEMISEPLSFQRASKELRDQLLEQFSTLYNQVYVRNTGHLKWLESLGAVFHPSDDPDFLYFEISK